MKLSTPENLTGNTKQVSSLLTFTKKIHYNYYNARQLLVKDAKPCHPFSKAGQLVLTLRFLLSH